MPVAPASGPGPALVPSTVPKALLFHSSRWKAWLRRTKQGGTICSQELRVWAGPSFARGAQAPPCLRGQMIPSAQLSRAVPQPHKLSQGGLGKDAQLWSLALADLTKPPQRLA